MLPLGLKEILDLGQGHRFSLAKDKHVIWFYEAYDVSRIAIVIVIVIFLDFIFVPFSSFISKIVQIFRKTNEET